MEMEERGLGEKQEATLSLRRARAQHVERL
jgi:hypothetical protein